MSGVKLPVLLEKIINEKVCKRKMYEIESSIEYYNINAKKFAEETASVDFEVTQKRFQDKLLPNAVILDFGCGSGRDTKFFLEQGYSVEAIDGSSELCKIASEYTGIKVKQMLFQDLAEIKKYDGIWACSSILHVPYERLADIITKMAAALKDRGIIYTSFKYGTYEGIRKERYFTDMTEDKFANLLKDVEHVRIEEQWLTFDVRPGRGEEQWLNLILRKK